MDNIQYKIETTVYSLLIIKYNQYLLVQEVFRSICYEIRPSLLLNLIIIIHCFCTRFTVLPVYDTILTKPLPVYFENFFTTCHVYLTGLFARFWKAQRFYYGKLLLWSLWGNCSSMWCNELPVLY